MITEDSPVPRGERLVLVVQGTHIVVERSSLALVSKFFRALFSHKFEDSQKEVLHLDTGGEMGLTVAAVQTLAEFARTKQVRMPEEQETAVQVFIAADALDIEEAREEAETFLGINMLRPDKVREESEMLTALLMIYPGYLPHLLANEPDFLHAHPGPVPGQSVS